MKKKNESKANGSARRAENQTSNLTEQFLWQSNFVASSKDCAAVIAGASKAIKDATSALLTPPAEDCDGAIYFEPFGPIKANDNIRSARFLICDVFEERKKKDYGDSGPFDSLFDCISFHPGLATERKMLKAMSKGCDALVGLENAYADGERRLTAIEERLAACLKDCATLEVVLAMLHREKFGDLLGEVEASKGLAESGKRMLWADRQFSRLYGWFEMD